MLSRVIDVLDFRNRPPDHPAEYGQKSPRVQSSTYSKALLRSKKSLFNLRRRRSTTTGEDQDAAFPENGPQLERHPTPPLPNNRLFVVKNRVKSNNGRSPHSPPVTTAAVELTVDALKTDAGREISTWVSIEVFAAVSNLTLGLDVQPSAAEDPLDVMILVDNS